MNRQSFNQFDALKGDGVAGAIRAVEITPLLKVPEAEFQLFARHSQQVEQISQAHGGLIGMGEAVAVEDAQNFVTFAVLVGERRRRSGSFEFKDLS